MKSFILIALFLLISSDTKGIEFYKEYTFDKDNKEFKFTLEQTGLVFFYVFFDGSSKVDLKILNGDQIGLTSSIEKPGKAFIVTLSQGASYTLSLTCTNEGESGTFLFNPTWNEIKVDLNKIYQLKLDIKEEWPGEGAKLIYSIDNADKDVTFKFEYNKILKMVCPIRSMFVMEKIAKAILRLMILKKANLIKYMLKLPN